MRTLLAVALLMMSCSDASETPCEGGAYCNDESWLCRPGMKQDRCATEQSITVLASDGSTSTTTLAKANDPQVDCFYVYPTVALSGLPGNVTNYDNLDDILVPLRMQAAPFGSLCRVFAPLYHQITLASYISLQKEQFMEVAYADVEAAWKTYLANWNEGRDVVLLGHSQGSHMLRRLLQREFETNDALRERLVVALAIGATGEITVPVGKTVGGTFQRLPLCTTPAERGCVIAYDSAAFTEPGTPVGQQDVACVNPAAIGSTASAPFRRSIFPTRKSSGQFSTGEPDLPTDLFALDASFSGQCARGATGIMQLQVRFTPPSGSMLASPIDLASANMHVLDYSFPLGDLLQAVQVKIEAGR